MRQRILPVDELHPGCELAEPITKNGDVLLLSGRRLCERDIDSLKRWGIKTATIKKETFENQRLVG